MSILRLLRGGQWVRKGYTDVPAQYDYTVNPGEDIQTVLNGATTDSSILIKSGTYRLSSPLNPKDGQTIAGENGTILSGSIALTSWVADGSGHWYNSGNLPSAYSDNGQCDDTSQNICQKREQIFINGVHMTRVMNLGAVTTNTFYQDYGANRTYIGQDPSGKLIEMSKTAYAVRSSNDNIRITGLIVQHFASSSQAGAVQAEGSDWEIDHNEVRWNHAIGIRLAIAPRGHVHHNNVHHNGQMGMGCYDSTDSLIEENELAFNNTDGYWPHDWESGGIKVASTDGATMRHNSSHDNLGVGIWYDINNINSLITDNDVVDNFSCGIRYEISYAGLISYNRVRGNGYGHASVGRGGVFDPNGSSLFATDGININGSSDVEVAYNTIGANQNGIGAQERNRDGGGDEDYGPWDTHNLWVHHNDVTLTTGTGTGIGVTGLNTLSPASTTLYYTAGKNNRFDYNTYHVDSLSADRFSWNHGYMTFAEWQAAGQEANGTCALAPVGGWQVVASGNDGGWSNNASPTIFSTTGTTIRIGDFSATDVDRSGWARFTGISIPKNATITSATLRLYATGLTGAPPSMTIDGEAADNATAPTTRADVNARVRTTAQASWVPASWPLNTWRNSPDITAVIQEIVNRTNWNAGNALQLFVNDAQPGQVTGQLSFRAYDGDPSFAANLQVTWS